jgi:hypothetical protein
MDVVAVEARRRAAVAAMRRRGPALPRMPHLPLPRPLDVRPRALPRQGRGRGLEEARPDRALQAWLKEPAAPRRADLGSHRAPRSRRGRGRRGLRRGRHLGAGRGPDPRRLLPDEGRPDMNPSAAAPRDHLPRGAARGASARRCSATARLPDGRGRRPLRRLLRVSARACSRSSARSASATRRCPSPASSAPASARRSAACARSSRS